MNALVKNCLEAFPELLSSYDLKTLNAASSVGSYIFFEDYFNEFIENNKTNESLLIKASAYIERLAQSEDQNVINLVKIGILEGLVSRQVTEIARHLKKQTKTLLNQCTSRTNIDKKLWQI